MTHPLYSHPTVIACREAMAALDAARADATARGHVGIGVFLATAREQAEVDRLTSEVIAAL